MKILVFDDHGLIAGIYNITYLGDYSDICEGPTRKMSKRVEFHSAKQGPDFIPEQMSNGFRKLVLAKQKQREVNEGLLQALEQSRDVLQQEGKSGQAVIIDRHIHELSQ